jgi:hypothetical protein
MKNTAFKAMIGTLAVGAVLLAQDPTDLAIGQSGRGFVFVGSAYGESNRGNLDKKGEFILPPGFLIDSSFRQAGGSFDGGGAHGISAADVPPGFYIRVDGGYYWAVAAKPQLVAEEFDGNVVKRWKLIVPMYCGPGGNGEGCNCKVHVWAKSK